MTTNHTAESELARLRAELLEFVMSELTAKLAEDPTHPASTALAGQVATAVERQLGAVRIDPGDVAEEILTRLRPELQALLLHGTDGAPAHRASQGAYETVRSHEAAPSERRLRDLLVGAGAGAALLLLGWAGGFFLAGGQVGVASPAPTAIDETTQPNALVGRDVPITNLPSDNSAGGAPVRGQ